MFFYTNNNGILDVHQYSADGPVFVRHCRKEDFSKRVINAGDFIMLINLYEYVIENDIHNSFINPNGERKEYL